MSEKKLSLFELHFHDSVQVGPRTLPGLGPRDEDAPDEPAALEEESNAEDEEDERDTCLVCRLVGLGVLVAAAYAVRKLLSGEPTGLDALDDIEAGSGNHETGESAGAGEPVSIDVTSGEESASSAGGKGLAAAAVVALLVVLALVVRKLLGDAVEELEVPEELAEE